MLSECIKYQSLEPRYCAISHTILHPMQPVQKYKSVQDKKCQVSLLCLNKQNHLSFFSCLFILSCVMWLVSSHVYFIFLFLWTLFSQGAEAVLRPLRRGARVTVIESQNQLRWKSPLRPWSPSCGWAAPCQVHHGTQCHILSFLQHLRDRDCTSSLPGQPIPQATTLGLIRVKRVSRYLKYSHDLTLFFFLHIQWCHLSLWFRNPIFPQCFQSRRKTLGFNWTIFSP